MTEFVNGHLTSFSRLVEASKLTSQFKASNGNGYVKFQFVAFWNEVFSYMLGFVVFLSTLKFLKLLRFSIWSISL